MSNQFYLVIETVALISATLYLNNKYTNLQHNYQYLQDKFFTLQHKQIEINQSIEKIIRDKAKIEKESKNVIKDFKPQAFENINANLSNSLKLIVGRLHDQESNNSY